MTAEKLTTRRWTCNECGIPPDTPCTLETKTVCDCCDPVVCPFENGDPVWVEVPLEK
jgi:hypothetical protein